MNDAKRDWVRWPEAVAWTMAGEELAGPVAAHLSRTQGDAPPSSAMFFLAVLGDDLRGLNPSIPTVKKAEETLLARMSSEEAAAKGMIPATGKVEAIPNEYWVSHKIRPEGTYDLGPANRNLSATFCDVLIRRCDLPTPIAQRTEPHAEAQNAIRRLRPTRSDGVEVPETAPDGWVHLLVASAKILNALFPEPEQTWELAMTALVEAAHRFDEPDDPSDTAVKVWGLFARNIDWACRTDTLITGYREIGGGGDPQLIPPSFWETEIRGLRLKTWCIDPGEPFSNRVDLPCWIWVTRDSLERQLERIDRFQKKKKIKAIYEGEWLAADAALNLLADAGPVPSARIEALAGLCGLGVCQAVAGGMVRMYRGSPVERDLHWPTTPDLWATLAPGDPRHSISESAFVIEDGENLWRLSDVVFDGVMLRKFLADKSGEPSRANDLEGLSEPMDGWEERWAGRRPTEIQITLFEFFEIAKQHMPSGSRPLNRTKLRRRYIEWLQQDNKRGNPYTREPFERWLDRYIQGYRPSSRKWEMSQ